MTLTTDDKRQLIYDEHRLDLVPVMKYARAQYRWDDATATKAEARYRGFLLVAWTWHESQDEDRKDEKVSAIDPLADKVWHCHLLLPIKYRDDCAAIFGTGLLLDHEPNPTGDRVVKRYEADLVAWAYGEAALEPPADLANECVWPTVG